MNNHYQLPDATGSLNKFLFFIFKWRLLWELLILIVVLSASIYTWNTSRPEDRIKDTFAMVGFGSVFFAVFFAILNYENIQMKNRYDMKKIGRAHV